MGKIVDMKIIGFDFDGVFINIENEKAKLFGDILHKYWGTDSLLASRLWLVNLGTSRRHKFDLIYQDKYHKDLQEDVYQVVEQEFSNTLTTDYYPKVQLVNETFETVRDLNDKFGLSFISSGIPHVELNAIASRFKLDEYFDLILGTSQNFRSKVDHFHLITRDNLPSMGIFIGDGLEDMRIAKQFKFTAIGLPVNHDAEELREAGADIICELPKLKQEVSRILMTSG
jgi:phosphoglycolate phosphatase-like HAD superfamily hydrolase